MFICYSPFRISPNQICKNTVGSYECECLPGFVKDLNETCIDIDECQNEKICNKIENSRCENTIGSYNCVQKIVEVKKQSDQEEKETEDEDENEIKPAPVPVTEQTTTVVVTEQPTTVKVVPETTKVTVAPETTTVKVTEKTVVITEKPVEKIVDSNIEDDLDAEKYYPKLPALYVGDKKFNYVCWG